MKGTVRVSVNQKRLLASRARRKLSLWMLAGLLGLWMLAGWTAPAQAHEPRRHRAKLVRFNPPIPAPDFTVSDPAGKPVALADFRGRYLLLNFWATWCPPCVREMPTIERLAKRFAKRPFAVLAISLDEEGAKKVRPFVARLGVTFPIGLDPESKVAERYGARDLPATFLIDPQGRVVVAAKGERDWDGPEIVEYLAELLGPES